MSMAIRAISDWLHGFSNDGYVDGEIRIYEPEKLCQSPRLSALKFGNFEITKHARKRAARRTDRSH